MADTVMVYLVKGEGGGKPRPVRVGPAAGLSESYLITAEGTEMAKKDADALVKGKETVQLLGGREFRIGEPVVKADGPPMAIGTEKDVRVAGDDVSVATTSTLKTEGRVERPVPSGDGRTTKES